MPQLSLFSAEVSTPAAADLAGLLCGHGRMAMFAGSAARVSVAVDAWWRARAIAEELAARGMAAGVGVDEEGGPLVRTPFLLDLAPVAAAWTRGAAKVVPPQFRLDGPSLRLWLLCAGRPAETRGYLFGLDPCAPQTHAPLADALARAGLRGTVRGPHVQVVGKRRAAALAALVGEPPRGGEAYWPC